MPKRPPVLAECKLCLNTTELRESHIIPKFLYRNSGLTGEKKKYDLVCLSNPELTERNLQDGIKEYMLCDICEQRLSKWEAYAREQFYATGNPLEKRPDKHFVWNGLDYTKMKLFTVSILWRMAVCTHHFYDRVYLMAKHRECLRKMLLEEDPREPWRYGCLVMLLNHMQKPLDGIFYSPMRAILYDHHCIRFIVAGMFMTIFVNTYPVKAASKECFLNQAGRWVLFKAEIDDIDCLKDALKYHREEHRLKP